MSRETRLARRSRREFRRHSCAGYRWAWVNWLVYDHEWVLPTVGLALSVASLLILLAAAVTT